MNRTAKDLTPAMRQYISIKENYRDCILFFRMGDFYEMFFDDAKIASRLLGIALTSRDREREIPMCGVPYHSAGGYIARLVREGYKVAICEQVEDPQTAKGIVERAVTRVITPGITLDEELLEAKSNNFIASALWDGRTTGFAYMDVSTGEFMVTELPDINSLFDEVRRIGPMELLVQESSEIPEEINPCVKKVSFLSRYDFDHQVAFERLTGHFGVATLDGFGLDGFTEGIRVAGALLQYVKETQKGELSHVKRCTPYHTGDYLVIDYTTRRNLEITENIRTGDKKGTLLELLDRTKTAMGGRRLRRWLKHPLKDKKRIERRLDAVEELLEKRDVRYDIQRIFNDVCDLERLAGRISMGIANPRDLVSLKDSLRGIPPLRELLRGCESELLSSISTSLDSVDEAVEMIEGAIVDNPPVSIRDGGIIKDGYSRELDDLRRQGSGGKEWIAGLEARERKRTGIGSLKIGYNKVFGYYIEVTRSNLSSIPQDYIRKQTLVNAERFVTPELKDWEEKVLSCEERARELETTLFTGIRDRLSSFVPRIQKTARLVSVLDVLVSFAQVSQEMNYTRPVITDESRIVIEEGRHPVVERGSPGDFVPNDLVLDDEENQILILTGPNMAGKSTYLRQNALIVFMAHVGCFVPASKATIGVVDRIFSRVGASDDISRGQSTFMVEMTETANILNNATPRSLVILDEIGRGTSTFDGLSIAWAVVEYLHDNPGTRAKTLFATHYHELTDLSLTKERVKNYNMAVKEWNDRVVFIRKVVPGGSNRSYGIQVARLAGLPSGVIERANEILRNLEKGEFDYTGMPRIAKGGVSGGTESPQLTLFGERDRLRDELRKVDINNTTPLEALRILSKMKEMIEN